VSREQPRNPIQGETSLDRSHVLAQLVVRGGRAVTSNAATIRNNFNLPQEIQWITLKVE